MDGVEFVGNAPSKVICTIDNKNNVIKAFHIKMN